MYRVVREERTRVTWIIHMLVDNVIRWNVLQLATNVWFAEDLAKPPMGPFEYKVCDGSGEDSACEDSVPAKLLNWADHNFYLNHSMYCCASGKIGPKECSFPF